MSRGRGRKHIQNHINKHRIHIQDDSFLLSFSCYVSFEILKFFFSLLNIFDLNKQNFFFSLSFFIPNHIVYIHNDKTIRTTFIFVVVVVKWCQLTIDIKFFYYIFLCRTPFILDDGVNNIKKKKNGKWMWRRKNPCNNHHHNTDLRCDTDMDSISMGTHTYRFHYGYYYYWWRWQRFTSHSIIFFFFVSPQPIL